jgi:hypothetical protein
MFFRHKRSGRTEYLQIVKNERVDGKAAPIGCRHPRPGR